MLLLLLLLLGVATRAEDVSVTYLGHSCFTIQANGGPVIMVDPYGSYVPYPALPKPADIVLMTHQHIDHCPWCYQETDRVEGDPILVYRWQADGRCNEKLSPGSLVITDDFKTHVIEGSHVTATGAGQGWVCMFSFEIGGVRFAHLGDLGRILDAAQMQALAEVDVLFIPVGGAFTLDAAEALTVIAQLPSVKVVIPMHYYVGGITPWREMAPVGDFSLVASALHTVREVGGSSAMLSPQTLPRSTEIWILEHATE